VVRCLTREIGCGRMAKEVDVKGITNMTVSLRAIFCIIGLF
jgi:hypothetical protein